MQFAYISVFIVSIQFFVCQNVTINCFQAKYYHYLQIQQLCRQSIPTYTIKISAFVIVQWTINFYSGTTMLVLKCRPFIPLSLTLLAQLMEFSLSGDLSLFPSKTYTCLKDSSVDNGSISSSEEEVTRRNVVLFNVVHFYNQQTHFDCELFPTLNLVTTIRWTWKRCRFEDLFLHTALSKIMRITLRRS